MSYQLPDIKDYYADFCCCDGGTSIERVILEKPPKEMITKFDMKKIGTVRYIEACLQNWHLAEFADTKAHDRRPKFSVQETRTRNSHEKFRSYVMHSRTSFFSRARNLFRVGQSSIPSKFLVQVSRTSFLGGELGSSVMGFSRVCWITSSPIIL